MMRRLLSVGIFAWLLSIAYAQNVTTNVSTPSGATHGSLVNGKLPKATGFSTVTDSGLPSTPQGNGSKIQLSTGTTTTGDCTKFDANGNTVDFGGPCGGSGSPGGSSGQSQYNNSGSFGGYTVGGDATLNTATGSMIVTKTNGTPFGTFATQSFATPPAIGGTTPNTGTFSSLKDTGILSVTQCLHANSVGLFSGTGADCAVSTVPHTQGDANYTIPSTVNSVELGTTLTAPRTDTLPCAASVAPGQTITIYDPAASVSIIYNLQLATDGVGCPSDTLNGFAFGGVGGSPLPSQSNTSLYAPGSTMFVTSDGIHNWSVHVSIPPAFKLDFATTFGARPALIPGTNSCTLGSGSATITCAGATPFSKLDVGDVVTAEGCGASGAMFTSYLTSVTVGTTTAVMHDTPSVASCGTVQIISQISPATGGLGYKFGCGGGAIETLTGGSAVSAAQQGCMTRGGVGAGLTRLGGSGGGVNGSCTLTLAPAAGQATALNNVQATMTGTISSGALAAGALTIVDGKSYTDFNTYTYDGSGNYENVPVIGSGTCSGLTGATVDVGFTIQTENPLAFAVYSTPPCNGHSAANSTTTSNASVSATFDCNPDPAVQWVGADNKVPMLKAFKAETAATEVGAPITIGFNQIFMASGIDPSVPTGDPTESPYILGPASWQGSGLLISGFYHIPNTGGDTFPVLESQPAGAAGDFGWTGTQNQAGTFFRDFALFGDTTSTTWDRGITAYGSYKWGTIQNLQANNLPGHLFGIGANSSGCGVDQESNFQFIRLFHVGNYANQDPAIGLDSIVASGASCGSPGANNIAMQRIRAFQDPYYDITVRPCNAQGGGNSAHIIMIDDHKSEKSGLEGTATAPGMILFNDDHCGATTANGTHTPFPSMNGGVVYGAVGEQGVGSVWITAGDFANPSLNSYAIEIEGLSNSDNSKIYIQADFTSAAASHGGGVRIQACGASCILDSPGDTTNNFGLDVTSYPNAGQIVAGSVEYIGHNNPVTFFADPGLSIMCSDGTGVLGQDGLCHTSLLHPGYRNNWHVPMPYNSNQTAQALGDGANTVVCEVGGIGGPGVTIDHLGANVATAVGGSNIQLAVYTDVGDLPTSLVTSTGSISAAGTGTVNASITAVSLAPVWYFWCKNADNAGVKMVGYSDTQGPSLLGATSQASVTGTSAGKALSATLTFGSWPASLSGTSWSAFNGAPTAIGFNVLSSP